jgi:hypothetical protein
MALLGRSLWPGVRPGLGVRPEVRGWAALVKRCAPGTCFADGAAAWWRACGGVPAVRGAQYSGPIPDRKAGAQWAVHSAATGRASPIPGPGHRPAGRGGDRLVWRLGPTARAGRHTRRGHWLDEPQRWAARSGRPRELTASRGDRRSAGRGVVVGAMASARGSGSKRPRASTYTCIWMYICVYICVYVYVCIRVRGSGSKRPRASTHASFPTVPAARARLLLWGPSRSPSGGGGRWGGGCPSACCVAPRAGVGYVCNVAVMSEARRRGVARRLMGAVEELAAEW